MPPARSLIFDEQTVELPRRYRLPPGVDLQIQSVVARIDDDGAAGDFVPCLAIYSQDNKLMARVPVSQTLAPGDSCIATWAPFLRGRRRASGASPLTTKGDVYGYSTLDARIPVGTDGEVLTSDSGAALGVSWGPGTPGAAVPVEWVYYESTTNWGSGGLTTLTFTEQGGNYDTGTPTFDLSGGNPQICRDGHYQTQVAVYNYVVTPGVETLIRADFERVSGPTPQSWRSPASALPQLSGGVWSTTPLTAWPFTVDFWDYAPGTFGATPTTWEVNAWRLDDGSIVADTDPVVRVAFQRLGDSYA